MARLLAGFSSLLLLVGCADIAAGPGAPSAPHLLADAQPSLNSAIQLLFPLRDGSGAPGDPYTWPVNAVFDHSMPLGAFCPDVDDDRLFTRVVAFTGEEGRGQERDGDGDPGVKGWKLRSSVKGICGKGPKLQGYAVSGGGVFLGPDGQRGTSDDPINYTGNSYLSYDGHPGIDYRATFIPVYAAADGTVIVASGCKVEIQHANGYSTVYDHLSAISIGQGWVTAGQPIGVSGECGAKGNPHLHFGVKLNGVEVDPYGWTGIGTDPYTATTGLVNRRLWPTRGVTFEAGQGANGGTDTSPRLSGISVGGFNRLLICAVGIERAGSPVTVSSLVFDDGSGGGAQAMTQLGAYYSAPADGAKWSTWYLVSPTTGGSRRVFGTLSAPAPTWVISCVSYSGVDQSTPFGTVETASAASGPASLTVSSHRDASLPWAHLTSANSGYVAGAGVTDRQIGFNSGPIGASLVDGNTFVSSGSSHTFNWSYTGSFGAQGATIRPATSP